MAKPKRVRTIEERLRLFDQHVTDLLSESGGQVGWGVHFDAFTGQATSTGPGRESLRSFLMAVRLLDSPNESDLHLPKVMDAVESFSITDERRQLVGMLREQYNEASVANHVSLGDLDGPITPRDSFELVAYSEHFHRNADYEARIKAMPSPVWQIVRFQAHFYAVQLSDIAMMLRSIARDDPATTHLFAPPAPGTLTAAERLAQVD